MCKVDSEQSECRQKEGTVMIVLGVDIAKSKFDAALLVNGKIKHKVFKNNQEGFAALLLWLLSYKAADKVHVCLEASSTYGEELATHMYDAGHTVSIVNPARIKGFAQSELVRTKTDKVDAGLIARFCLAMHPESWEPVPADVRRLQALVRRVDALLVMRTQELNRLDVAQDTVYDSLNGHIAYLDQEIEKLKRQIGDQIKDDPDLRAKSDLLRSIPGVGEATISSILSELALFERCDRVQKIVAFMGLAPKQFLSGSSIKGKPRLSKMGNARLRKALYMPALVAMRYNPVIVAFALRLREKGKNGKVIVCAAMRKLVHIIFGVLKSRTPFDATIGLKRC